MNVNTDVTFCDASFPARFSNSEAAVRWVKLNHKEFDLVVFHSSWSILNVRVAINLRWVPLPYVVIAHGSLDPFDLQKKALLKSYLGPLVIRRYLSKSRAILCSTRLEADRLVTYGAKPPVYVLPWAVQREEPTKTAAEVRAALGVLPSEFLILSLGRVDYKKGFPVLISAFRRLVESGVSARLLIVGPDSNGYIEKVKVMVMNAGVGGAVSFCGPILNGEKTSLMRAADCFALPSLNENFGNTVVEAMQVGTPVVVSTNVYIAEDIGKARAGFVCSYDDNDVFHAFSRLANDASLRQTMSRAAVALGDSYLPENLRSQYVQCLSDIMAGRAP
eukprot:gene26134-34174_t